jgi:hypothetical protein
VPADLQAQVISRALHRLWIAGVSLVDWQFLIDPYGGTPLASPDGGIDLYPRPAGLYSPGPGGNTTLAHPKPFLRGFALPFDPLRVNRRHVRVWALLVHGGTPALLQRQGHGGGWRTIARLRADPHGVLNRLLQLVGPMRLRLHAGALSSATRLVAAHRAIVSAPP